MVALHKKKPWRVSSSAQHGRSSSFVADMDPITNANNMGILALEAARTMSRLLNLRRSLSVKELARLRLITIRSPGVSFLNSADRIHLLRLACAELLDGLDRAVESISRLCRSHKFGELYSKLKSGDGDLASLALRHGETKRSFRKLEGHVSIISKLQVAMGRLAELEAYERRSRAKRKGSFHVDEKLSLQRQVVKKLKERSLWSEKGDKAGELMSRAVVTIFARLCAVFAPVVIELPLVVLSKNGGYRFSLCPRERQLCFSSKLQLSLQEMTTWTSEVMEAPRGTLGGSGMALRYANVVTAAGRIMETGEEEGREELYQLLPSAVRGRVRAKMRGYYCRGVLGEEEEKEAWRGAAVGILEWLRPMAEDTERWYAWKVGVTAEEERRWRVLGLQTLVFSDREKVEAAVVELLVALSCAARYDRQQTVGEFSDVV